MKNGRYNSINLADDPAYSSIKAQLNEQLISVLIKEEDPRMVEEVCRFEIGEYIL